ncbi:MAG: tetratricopeptide repeat protein [Chloroflexota bacterium]
MTFRQRWIIGLLIFVLGLSTGVVSAQQTPTPTPPTAQVSSIHPTVDLHTGPNAQSSILRQVPTGTEVILIGSPADHQWYRVRLPDNHTGWIAAEFLLLPENANATPTPREQAIRLTVLGDLRFAKKQYDAALQYYDQALALDVDYAVAYEGRGQVYITQGDFQRGIDEFNHAVELNDHGQYLYEGRGLAYAGLGQNDQALADFNRAIEIDPQYGTLYTLRGGIYSLQGRYDLAITDFTQAITLDSTDYNTYYLRGISYFNSGRANEALADFNHALELAPNEANLYAWRGFASNALGASKEQILADLCHHIQLAGANAITGVNDFLAYHGWQCPASS